MASHRLDLRIAQLEAELNALKDEHAKVVQLRAGYGQTNQSSHPIDSAIKADHGAAAANSHSVPNCVEKLLLD